MAPLSVRLPHDLREQFDAVLRDHPLLRQSVLLHFAVDNAIAMIRADPSIVESFVRHRHSRGLDEERQRLCEAAAQV